MKIVITSIPIFSSQEFLVLTLTRVNWGSSIVLLATTGLTDFHTKSMVFRVYATRIINRYFYNFQMMINSATLFSIGFIAYGVLIVLFHMLHNNDLYVICIKLISCYPE